MDQGGSNFHANHHLRHLKNFGIYNCLMDMYFGTAIYNDEYEVNTGLYALGQESIYNIVKGKEELNGEPHDVLPFTRKKQ